MPRKFFVRTVAVVLAIGLLVAIVPVLKSAERKTSTPTNVLQMLKQPLLLLSSLFPAATLVQETTTGTTGNTVPPSRVRPTGDSPVYRPGTGD
jgi:hypothetical protein